MNEDPDPRNRWQRAMPNYSGMSTTLAYVGLGAAIFFVVVLLVSRSGDDVRSPERPSAAADRQSGG